MNIYEGIKIISPQALWLAPLLLGLLLYLYRRGGRGMVLTTPSLILLSKITSKPQLRSRIMPPWRFFLELLLGLMLILGISQLSKSKPNHIKVIIDNSLSMASLQRDGRSRLIAAKNSAKSFIDSLASTANIAVLVTSPKLKEISLAELKNVEAEAAPDLLTEAVDQFLEDSEVHKVAVFTDKKLLTPENNRLIWKDMQPSNDGRNFAFKALSFNPIDNTISASITLYSNEPAQVRIKLETNYEAYEVLRVVEERTIKLAPETTQTVVFSGIDRDSDFARLSLNSLDIGVADDNPLDNVAYLALERQAQITLVSGFDRKDLGIDKLGLSIRTVTPDEWERSLREPNRLQDNQDKGVIFHRYFPQIRPDLPVIAILPPISILSGTTFNGENLISSWKQPHPLTRYLSLQSLKLNRGRVFNASDTIEPIISSEQGSILATETSTANRTALVGFELLPFKGSEDLTISILTLNLLNWSFEKALNSGTHPLFDRIKTPNSVISVTSPDESVKEISGSFLADKVGIWRSFGSLETTRTSKFYAVNFFSDAESDILHPTELSITNRGSSGSEHYASLLGWLAAIALALLILDSLIAITRKQFRKSASRPQS